MDYDYEINIVDLVKKIIKKWRVLLISALVLSSLLTVYAFVNTKTYYRAQITITVLGEDTKNPVEKIGVINRNDVVKKTVDTLKLTTSVEEAISNISISRYNYSNELVVTYRSLDNNAVTVLNALTANAVETINKISNYKVESKALATAISNSVVGPSKVRFALLGLVGGCVLATIALAIQYLLENKIRDKDYIESVLKYKVLSENDKNTDLFRKLRTNLGLGFKNDKVIAISSYDEEGKEVAANLAKSLSEIKGRVLLVEQGDNNGLFDYLKKEAELSSVITKQDNLLVINYNDDEQNVNMIQSGKYKETFEQLRNAFDYIIVSTPLAGTNEATVFEAECDGTVLVITKDKTSAKTALENKKDLELVNANVLGAVFRS